jgi:hypothetical protein
MSDSPFETNEATSFIRNWVFFQNRFNLSYRAASSDEFRLLCLSLIRLGQQISHTDPETLLPNLTRGLFLKAHQELAKESSSETVKLFHGKTVSLCLDATKIGHVHYLLCCATNPFFSSPRFVALRTNVMTQENYAQACAGLLTFLKDRGINVGTICTDGLPCQVNAISGKYIGFI